MHTLREQFHSVKGAEISHENMTEEGLKSRLSSDNPCIKHFPLQVFLGKYIYYSEEERNIALQPAHHIRHCLSPKLTQKTI